MNVLIINQILYTVNGKVHRVSSIKDTMIYGMCLGFKELGCDVTLCAAEEYRPVMNEEYDFNVMFFKSDITRFCPPSVLPVSWQLYSFLKEHHSVYDLIISSEVFSVSSLFASLLCPKKTVIWQEMTCHQRKFKKIPSRIWHNLVAKFFMRNVLSVVPRSKSAYKFISKYMPSVSSNIVDHGIDTVKFKYSTQKKRQIITSSQLIYRKNVDGIIQKFRELHEQDGYEDIKLLIAGRGDEEQNLRNLVSELNLSDYVEFLGFLSQDVLNEHISKSMCFLVNTRQDLNMVSIAEAVVSGTPILTNTKPASADYIRENKLGIVKEDWNSQDIMKIIDKNAEYVKNCIGYRDSLTYTSSAQGLMCQIDKN